MRNFFFSLRFRLILLVLLAIIPAMGLILYTAAHERQTVAEAVRGEMLHQALHVSAQQDLLAEITRQLLAGLARLHEVKGGDAEACSALSADLLDEYPFYANLIVARPDGDLWCSGLLAEGPVNYADRHWFQEAIQTRHFVAGGYVMGRVTRRPMATFAYPLLDEAGQVQAVLAAGLDLVWLDQHLAQTPLPEGAVLTVVDGQGAVLAHTLEAEKWAGQSALEAEIVQAVLAQRSQGTVEAMGVDGVRRLYAFTPLGEGGYVLVGIPTAQVYAEADRVLRGSLAALGLVTLLALAAAWLGGEVFIVWRVNALMVATQRMAAGDLRARTGVKYGVGEFSQLARAFDEMAESLEEQHHEREQAEAQILAAHAELQRLLAEAEQSRRALLSVVEDQMAAQEEIRRLNVELEQRVRQRTAQLEAANQELEAFAYSVSHDLRAPLRALDGFSAALLADYPDKLDEQGRHYLARIQAASQRMGRLINDLLDLSRITRREMSHLKVDLSALAREIAAELQAEEPQRPVEWAIADGLAAQGDAHLLRVALQNLLGNAWKFTGGRERAIIEFGLLPSPLPLGEGPGVRAPPSLGEGPGVRGPLPPGREAGGEGPVYFVRDNGVGFDMAYAGQLFAPFQRLHSLHEFPGMGVGLATVQRIVTRHGGRVWAEAAVDRGATFYFTLGS